MLIECRSLSRSFVRGGRLVEAVRNVDFSIRSGDFVSITGSSGSGKTTLLNLLSLLLRPTSGRILVDGSEIPDSERAVAEFRNARVGWISQSQTLLSNLTVFDNVRLPAFALRGKLPKAQAEAFSERALSLLERFGVLPLAESYPESLSGGELQRVVAARAFLNRPSLVLADEPTANLDGENALAIADALRSAAGDGAAVIFVTHDLAAARSCPVRYSMRGGRLSREV